MTSTKLFLMLCLGALGAAPLAAEELDIPLAVTTLAHPSMRTTPTAGEKSLSDKYLHAGLAFLAKNQPQRAVQELKDAVRLAPSGDTYKALGTAYYQADDKRKAAWAYRESLQLKPDAKVQALVDALEGKDHPEEQFANKNDEIRHQRLLDQAKVDAKAGKRDSALRDYVEAYEIKAGRESAGPAYRLAADLADEDLADNAVAKAIEVMASMQPLKGARDLNKADLAALGRLDKAETKVVTLTGAKLREHEKAMLSDREGWERAVAEKMAGKVNSINLDMKGH